MRSLRDDAARSILISRIHRLSAESRRQWGRMEITEMVAHLSDQLRIAMGDVAVREVKGPLRFALPRYLFIHLLPWPRGRAKAPPESFTTRPTTLDDDRATLIELIERFAVTPAERLSPVHPLFGRMTPRDWDVLSHKHLDHHLRQFSV